jgi:hypothetical protein
VQLMKRIVGAGLGLMGAVTLGAAIWPAVAGLVTGLLITALCAGGAALATLGGRWVRAELAWRRELRAMGPVSAEQAVAPGPVLPTLAELRHSA